MRQSDTGKITWHYFALLVTMGLSGAVLGPALPTLRANVGTSTETIALLFTAKAFGAMAGAFLIGGMYDRFPGHRVMSAALAALFPTLIIAPFTGSFPLMMFLVLIAGICEGGLHVGSNTLLVRLHREKVAPYMNGLHFSFGIGAAAAPALLGLSFNLETGIAGAFTAIALPVGVLSLLFLRLPTPEPHEISHEEASSPPIRKSLPLLIGLIFFLYVGAEASFSGWIFSYAVARDLADETSAALLTSLFWTGLTAGRLLGILLARRFSPEQILPLDILFGIGAVILIALTGRTFTTVALGTTLYGFAIASIFPMTMALAGERMRLSGSVTGWFFVGAAAGGMTLPWLIGQFFESVGPETVPAFAFLSLLLALGVFGVIKWIGRRREGTVD